MAGLTYADWVLIALGAIAIMLCCRIFSFFRCARSPANSRVRPFDATVRQVVAYGQPGPPPVPAWGAVSRKYEPVPFVPVVELGADPPSCIICIENFREGDLTLKFPCSHLFHYDCIRQWYSKQPAPLCPLCKRNVLEALVVEEVVV